MSNISKDKWCSTKVSPVYLTSIFKLLWNPARTVRRKKLQHLALRIFFRPSESFMGVWNKIKKEKWSSFREESIINQASIFLSLLKNPNLTHPSCSNLYFILNCKGILKGEITGWFTRTFSWWIDLVKGFMYVCLFSK